MFASILFAASKSEGDPAIGFVVLALMGLAVIFAFACYFLPSLLAYFRGHGNLAPILIVNVFFGWTFVGWIVALAWCFSHQEAPYRRRGY
jgi:hypothetical protein